MNLNYKQKTGQRLYKIELSTMTLNKIKLYTITLIIIFGIITMNITTFKKIQYTQVQPALSCYISLNKVEFTVINYNTAFNNKNNIRTNNCQKEA